jgi:hypothetical protein
MPTQILDTISDRRKVTSIVTTSESDVRRRVEIVEFPIIEDLVRQGYLQVIDELRTGSKHGSVLSRDIVTSIVTTRVPVVRK